MDYDRLRVRQMTEREAQDWLSRFKRARQRDGLASVWGVIGAAWCEGWVLSTREIGRAAFVGRSSVVVLMDILDVGGIIEYREGSLARGYRLLVLPPDGWMGDWDY